MKNPKRPQPSTRQYNCTSSDSQDHKPGPAHESSTCQPRNPSSSLPQGAAGPSAQSPQKSLEAAVQKRQLRLMKNREAAKECRRRKKEYVRCLENRVAMLEKQQKALMDELKALKD